MHDLELAAVIEAIDVASNLPSPLGPLRSLVLPRLTWDPSLLEEGLAMALPIAVKEMWNRTSGLVMFWDITYSQWGLVLWSPDQAYVRHRRFRQNSRLEEWREGDLIVGEFLGDSDLLVLRCDPGSPDFGTVVISKPIDHRNDWVTAAKSLGEFVQQFWISQGEKFWESSRA